MYYFWIGLLGAIALLWSILGLRMLRGMAGVPRLAGVMPLPDGECPKVSILFAARDVVSRWDVIQAHTRATATTAAQFLDTSVGSPTPILHPYPDARFAATHPW